MTIKVAAMVLAAVMAAVAPAAAGDPPVEGLMIAQASNGKLGQEVSFLVCTNFDQTSVGVSGTFIKETGSVGYGFWMMPESRIAVNLANVPGLAPTAANFSIALYFDTADFLPSSLVCDVVYYSQTPLREVGRAPLTVRKFTKR